MHGGLTDLARRAHPGSSHTRPRRAQTVLAGVEDIVRLGSPLAARGSAVPAQLRCGTARGEVWCATEPVRTQRCVPAPFAPGPAMMFTEPPPTVRAEPRSPPRAVPGAALRGNGSTWP